MSYRSVSLLLCPIVQFNSTKNAFRLAHQIKVYEVCHVSHVNVINMTLLATSPTVVQCRMGSTPVKRSDREVLFPSS